MFTSTVPRREAVSSQVRPSCHPHSARSKDQPHFPGVVSLSGRYPYKLSATRANLIPWTVPDGISLNYSMLPRKLKAAGYESYHIGKWHQGLYTPQHTPVGRGFDHSYGFLEGGEDHNTSRTFGNYCKLGEVDLSHNRGEPDTGKPFPYKWSKCTWKELPGTALHSFFDPGSVDINGYSPHNATYPSPAGCKQLCQNRIDCRGYSWRDADPSHPYYHKCFLVSKVGPKKASTAGFTSAVCQRESGPTTKAAIGDNGTYTGYLFSAEAVRVVEAHDTSRPLFMYLALHDTHAPLEAPWEFVEPYMHWNDTKRAIFSGMLSFVDATVQNLTRALHRKGMWENTLFVWTNDNGSPVFVGGSNHPLRGGKGSNWEGGTRVPAFVTGGVLPAPMRGRVHPGLIHIADWHATILGLAGLDPRAGEPHANSPLDGMDAWPWLSGKERDAARREIVYDHDMYHNADAGCTGLVAQGRCVVGAIQVA